MLRYSLLLLLLLPYLLGIGAGLVGRAEPTGPSAGHPYVHSAQCQPRNYLRLDCFDTCNGDQSAVKAQAKTGATAQLLAAFKSIDLHCLPEAPRVVAWLKHQTARYPWAAEPAVLKKKTFQLYQPPRQA